MKEKKDSDQYNLFTGIAPFERGSETSRAAAASVTVESKDLRTRVFREIRRLGHMTCDEVEIVTGLKHQTASARIRELALKGLIKDSGKRRLTRSGRKAVVYEPA